MPISRARIFQLTRSLSFLWQTGLAVIAASIGIGGLVIWLGGRHQPESAMIATSWEQELRDEFEGLLRAKNMRVDRVVEFLRELTDPDEEVTLRWKYAAGSLKLGPLDLQALLSRQVADEGQRTALTEFVRARFDPYLEERTAAKTRLMEAAARTDAARFVSELSGEVCAREGRPQEALQEFLREGRRFDDAWRARRRAFEVALKLADADALREMCSDARWRAGVSSSELYEAAKIVRDPALLWISTIRTQLHLWRQPVVVALALFAALIWYVVLVYAGGEERWRWVRPLTCVLAGVMSVWLLHWVEGMAHFDFNHDTDGATGAEFVRWIMGVGLPEEAAKLVAFSVFLPTLLRSGSVRKAALLAGCTGLGFALCENLAYFHMNPLDSVGRLVTANFLHIAMTAISGSAFFVMVQSRFHRVGEFLATFAAVAVVHGIYDLSTTGLKDDWAGKFLGDMGFSLISTIILAASAKIVFDRLRPEMPELRRHTVSCSFVFCIGGAILTGMTIITMMWQSDSFRGATWALKSVISIFPIVILYVREFREV